VRLFDASGSSHCKRPLRDAVPPPFTKAKEARRRAVAPASRWAANPASSRDRRLRPGCRGRGRRPPCQEVYHAGPGPSPAPPLRPPEGAFTLRTRSRRGRPSTCPGAAPAGFSAADISALPPESVGHGSRVTQDHWEVGPLSWGVMSPGGSTPVRPATGRPSLPPRSFTRRPIGSPCGALSPRVAPRGRRRAYHVPPMYRGWGGPQLSAGGAASACGEFGAPYPGHVPFGPSVSASCACSM
jgi:hypothetical protein